MDVDVLLTGSTHRFEIWENEGRFYVNPGTATGAWSSHWPLFADDDEGDAAREAATEEKEDQKDVKGECMRASCDAAAAVEKLT